MARQRNKGGKQAGEQQARAEAAGATEGAPALEMVLAEPAGGQRDDKPETPAQPYETFLSVFPPKNSSCSP